MTQGNDDDDDDNDDADDGHDDNDEVTNSWPSPVDKHNA